MLNWLPISSTSLNSAYCAYSNPLMSTITSMPIFGMLPSSPVVPAVTSGTFSFLPSFSSIGNYFSNMFSNFSLPPIMSGFSLTSFSRSASAGSKAVSSAAVSGGQKVDVSCANQNESFWKRLGYCAQKGLQLAKDATRHIVGFIGKCATYVKNAIARCGLGSYKPGNGCDMVNVLKNNKNFKQISPDGVDLKKLPAGCVLVYGRGVGGYSKAYGHTEITTGTGKAVSDGVTRNLHKKPTAIFIPV